MPPPLGFLLVLFFPPFMVETHQHAKSFLENAKDFQIRVRGAVEQHRDGMEGNESSKVKSVLGPPGEVAVEFVIDGISQITLLKQSAFLRRRFPLGKKRREGSCGSISR